jgi:hypothetical protein
MVRTELIQPEGTLQLSLLGITGPISFKVRLAGYEYNSSVHSFSCRYYLGKSGVRCENVGRLWIKFMSLGRG